MDIVCEDPKFIDIVCDWGVLLKTFSKTRYGHVVLVCSFWFRLKLYLIIDSMKNHKNQTKTFLGKKI